MQREQTVDEDEFEDDGGERKGGEVDMGGWEGRQIKKADRCCGELVGEEKLGKCGDEREGDS